MRHRLGLPDIVANRDHRLLAAQNRSPGWDKEKRILRVKLKKEL